MGIPVPVHEKLVDNERIGTTAFIRFLNELSRGVGDTTIITNIVASGPITPNSQTVLCDATVGDIDITLPNPLAAFKNQRSIKVAISRIDETANSVTILPNGADLILGETSQFLEGGDVVNFVTDGTNWYLGA